MFLQHLTHKEYIMPRLALVLLFFVVPNLLFALEPRSLPGIDEHPWCSDSRLLQSPIDFSRPLLNDTYYLSTLRLPGIVTHTALHKNRRTMAIAHDTAVEIYAIDHGRVLHRHTVSLETPAKQLLFLPEEPYVIILSADGRSLSIRNTETGLKRMTPPILYNPIVRLALSPNGQFLASIHEDKSLIVYDLQHQESVFRMTLDDANPEYLGFLARQSMLVVANQRHQVLFVPWRKEKDMRAPLPIPGRLLNISHDGKDQQILAIEGHGLYRYQAESHDLLPLAAPEQSAVMTTLFDDQAQLAVSALQNGAVHVYELHDGHRLFQGGHTVPVQSYDLNAEAASLISLGKDGSLSLWDIKKGTLVDTMRLHGMTRCKTYMIAQRQAVLIRSDDSDASRTRIDVIQWKTS